MECADGLSDIAIVTVNVVNVPENALMPDTLLQIDENSLDGADVGIALQTVDLDFSDEGYIEHIIPGPPYPFYVDMMMQTRIVTLNNVGTTALLDAELKNLYYYKVLIKDFTTLDGPVMASNGELTVQILNLNESPQISAQLYTYTVMENATVGTLVGSLTAFDPDFDSNLHYSIKSGDKESQFRIVRDNSQPLYAQILTDNVLDYELVQHYALICEVVDESELSTSGIFNVQVIDVNDIQVSSVSIVDPTFGRQLTMATNGKQIIRIYGSNLGVVDNPLSNVTLMYTNEYVAPGNASFRAFSGPCTKILIGKGNEQIDCISQEGHGAHHRITIYVHRIGDVGKYWRYEVSNEIALDYSRPSISIIDAPGNLMTTGNESVYLTGTNFGPISSTIKIDAEYGPNGFGLCALSCKVVISHMKVECVSSPGSGGNHKWTIWVGHDRKSEISFATTSYRVPQILMLFQRRDF